MYEFSGQMFYARSDIYDKTRWAKSSLIHTNHLTYTLNKLLNQKVTQAKRAECHSKDKYF